MALAGLIGVRHARQGADRGLVRNRLALPNRHTRTQGLRTVMTKREHGVVRHFASRNHE